MSTALRRCFLLRPKQEEIDEKPELIRDESYVPAPSERFINVEYRLTAKSLWLWLEYSDLTGVLMAELIQPDVQKCLQDEPVVYDRMNLTYRGWEYRVGYRFVLQQPLSDLRARYCLRLFAEELSPLFEARVMHQGRVVMHSFRREV